jgi:hypothetical protein
MHHKSEPELFLPATDVKNLSQNYFYLQRVSAIEPELFLPATCITKLSQNYFYLLQM